MKSIALAFVLLFSSTVAAQSQHASATREIGQLFVVLERSGCQFYRNGSWHNSKQAASHLRRKYDYLAKKGLVTTTESFIDLAATKSSVSGKPYMVKCPDAAAVESKVWLTHKLVGLRSAGAGANNSFKPKPLRGSA
ncbi:DUF5329 domain-containing protein [Luteimonas sp. SX5]|uniref:DUF5329 domain-containing protein n=1 Tax=Luteimonas galliterrae TaxID=2940486 RepID=A0ABT0MN79_9GAMM|nr:DUF5329 domain-containing protein [Luteimonas galliterrae]MCL1636143.1 DUF5329 domain-containing protein [Luteimonas galliterrae]